MQHNQKVVCYHNTIMRAAKIYEAHKQLPLDFVVKFIGSAMRVCNKVVADVGCEFDGEYLVSVGNTELAYLILDEAMGPVAKEYCYTLIHMEIVELEFEMLGPDRLLWPYGAK